MYLSIPLYSKVEIAFDVEVEDAFERNDGEDSAVFRVDETINSGVCDRVLRRNRGASDSAVGVER